MQAYADVRKQLDEELSVKNHVIKETSSKLEEHQDELIKVKDELNKSKKKLVSASTCADRLVWDLYVIFSHEHFSRCCI